jgi:hypothetical protein
MGKVAKVNLMGWAQNKSNNKKEKHSNLEFEPSYVKV